jgi:hypothetical protein
VRSRRVRAPADDMGQGGDGAPWLEVWGRNADSRQLLQALHSGSGMVQAGAYAVGSMQLSISAQRI